MKKLITLLAATGALTAVVACSNDDKTTWDEYADWREANQTWFNEQQQLLNPDGTPFYDVVTPDYNPTKFLMHFCEAPATNAGNLQPLYTSWATVNYTVRLYSGELIDSGHAYTSQLNSQGLITGWAAAIMRMHVGDTAQIVLPYDLAYGPSGTSNVKPYSALQFNIRLTDIPYYEIRP